MENNRGDAFYCEIIGHINDYIYSITLEKDEITQVYHSPKALQLTGYTSEELTENRSLWIKIIHPDDREMVVSFLNYARKSSSSSTIEHRIIHRNGSIRWVRNSCSIVINDKQRWERLDGVVSDITERKKRTLELTRLTRVVEQSPSSVVVTDITGAIEYANPKCCKVTGYSLEELKGQNPRLLKSGDKPEEYYRKLWQTISSGQEWFGEFENRAKDGHIFYELASISALRDENGVIVNYIGVKEDITPQKIAEFEIIKREKELEKRNAKYKFELHQAQRLQQALIPKNSMVTDVIDSAFLYHPMEEVGGDFFAFSEHFDNSIGLFIADVSGHGVSAALYLTLIKHISEKIIQRLWNMPDRVLYDINRELVNSMEENFITALYGYFTPYVANDCISFHYANGGHTNSIVYYKKSDSYELFNCKGTILGMFEEYVVECDTLTLTSGDRLFFFTDGIVELADPDYSMLGYEGLIELLKKKQKLPIAELVSHVDDELVLYSKGKESDDDILMIAFEIK